MAGHRRPQSGRELDLTGLPNRALLTDRLLHSLARSRSRGSRVGVMFFDIDHLKVVNDSLGHTFGDDLLRGADERIAGAIRAGDTVARFGGDEFVVVCDDESAADIRRPSDGWPRHRHCTAPSRGKSSPSTTSQSWTSRRVRW